MIAQIIENNKLTDNIFQLKCRVKDYNGFIFEPGQYIIIKKNIDGDVIKRAYSFSSLPKYLPDFELTIRKHTDGKMSPVLVDLGIGEFFEFLPPMGLFNWKMVKNRNIVLIAIGCGIAPLKSMIDGWLEKPKKKLNLILFFGNRYPDQVPYQKYFADLAEKYNNFHFYSCVSRLEKDQDGLFSGRVNEVMSRKYYQYQDTDFVLCGSDEMIKGMKDFLDKKGVKSDRIYFENVLA